MLSVLTLALAVAAAEPIHVEERRPISVVLLAPLGALGALKVIDASALFAGLSLELEPKTDLEIEPLEPERAADCAGSLSCLIDRTRPRSTLFLVLSAVSTKQNDRISATLVDLEAARREIARADPTDREAKDSAITEHAVLLRPRAKEIANADDLKKWMRDLVAFDLRSTLEAQGSWEPFGELSIEGAPKGSAIAIDGVTVGIVQEGNLAIAGVKTGARMISIEHPEMEPAQIGVEVERGRVARVVPALVARQKAPSQLRTPLFWTGAGSAAVGTGIVVYAVVAAGRTEVVCLTNDPASSSCSKADAFHGDGIALAPLGYSIFGAGAAWAIGALLFGDPQDPPWIALLTGVGVGVASFVLSTALDGDETP